MVSVRIVMQRLVFVLLMKGVTPEYFGRAGFHMASVGDTHELAKDMFALIDADSSGEITVHEMHAVVSDLLGLDLSVEDVFNVVQDIDEDGNGELDLEEFEVLLERFGIFEDLMHVAK